MSMTTPVPVDGLPKDIGAASGGRRNDAVQHWRNVGNMLRDRPEQWFIVAEDASSSIPSKINNGKLKALGEGTFESRGYKSKQLTKTHNVYEKIYARYIGPRVPLEEPKPVPTTVHVDVAEVIEHVTKRTPNPVPAPPVLTPMQKVAVSIARHHADARKIVWMDLDESERARRVEAAGVAYQTVYGLIADDMENTVKAKVRRVSPGAR